VLVHREDAADRASADLDRFLESLAIHASSRHFGVGSDGLLVLGRTSGGELELRMFNPDGTEDFCGNGLRCAFAHALRQGWIQPGEATVTHLGRRVPGSVERAGDGYAVSFTLPPASYRPIDIPTSWSTEAFDEPLFEIDGRAYRGSVLTTGSAHTILPVDNLPQDDDFFRVSPQIENHPMFPERTSIMWVQEVGPNEIKLRIWERGAGETLGCGTGSTAAAIDYLRRNGHGGEVLVHNPGGTLMVSAPDWTSPVRVTGKAKEVFRGDLVLPSREWA
jgi:diaminopimelate epimerase